MVKQISNKFHAWARGWLVLALVALDIFFMGFIMPLVGGLMKSGTGGEHALDLQFFSTPATIFTMVASYGEYGRAFYRSVELTVDILYPIVYTLAFGLLLSWLLQRGFPHTHPVQAWNVLPLGIWFFDLIENLSIVGLLSTYPAQWIALAWLTAAATMAKWVFAGASAALIVVGLIAAMRNGFRSRDFSQR